MSRVIDLSAQRRGGGGSTEPLVHPAGVTLPFEGPSDAALIIPEIRSAIRAGDYSAEVIRLLPDAVRPGDRVLVIGAGLGIVSTLIARTPGVERVIAVEANTLLVPYLERVHEMNGVAWVETVNAVLAEGKKGRVPFFARRDITASSLLPHDQPWQQVMMVPFMDLELILAEERITLVVSEIPLEAAAPLGSVDLHEVERILLACEGEAARCWEDEGLYAQLARRGFVPEPGTGAVLFRRRDTLESAPPAEPAEQPDEAHEAGRADDVAAGELEAAEARAPDQAEPEGEGAGSREPEGGESETAAVSEEDRAGAGTAASAGAGPANTGAAGADEETLELAAAMAVGPGRPRTGTDTGHRRRRRRRRGGPAGGPSAAEGAGRDAGASPPSPPHTPRDADTGADRPGPEMGGGSSGGGGGGRGGGAGAGASEGAGEGAGEGPGAGPVAPSAEPLYGALALAPARLWRLAALVVVLVVPLMLIQALALDREARRAAAVADIRELWGGPQRLLGPFLLVPVQAADGSAAAPVLLLPDRLDLDGFVDAREESREVFTLPVYVAQLDVELAFDASAVDATLAAGDTPRWDEAVLGLALSEPRALRGRLRLETPAGARRFGPGSGVAGLPGIHAVVGDPRAAGGPWRFGLTLAGSEALELAPAALVARVALVGDWPHPRILGRFRPEEAVVGAAGAGEGRFAMRWTVPAIAHGLPPASRDTEALARLDADAFGIALEQPVPLYEAAARAVRYGLPVIALTFLTLLVVGRGSRRPPGLGQLALVGATQCVFFLLLLSLAEQIGLTPAYLLAAGATIALVTFYAWRTIGLGRRAGWVALALLAFYAAGYLLMVSESHGLLVAALSAFLALLLIAWANGSDALKGGAREGG